MKASLVEHWCSQLKQVTQSRFHGGVLVRSQSPQAANQLSGIETGESLNIHRRYFVKPAWLAQRHFSPLIPNLRGQRSNQDQDSRIGRLRIGENQDRAALFDYSQFGIPDFAGLRFK